jgi:hypothetical protein
MRLAGVGSRMSSSQPCLLPLDKSSGAGHPHRRDPDCSALERGGPQPLRLRGLGSPSHTHGWDGVARCGGCRDARHPNWWNGYLWALWLYRHCRRWHRERRGCPAHRRDESRRGGRSVGGRCARVFRCGPLWHGSPSFRWFRGACGVWQPYSYRGRDSIIGADSSKTLTQENQLRRPCSVGGRAGAVAPVGGGHCQVVGDDIVTKQQQAHSGRDCHRPDA